MGLAPMEKKRQDCQPRLNKKKTPEAKRLRKKSSQQVLDLIHQTSSHMTGFGQSISDSAGRLDKDGQAASGMSSSARTATDHVAVHNSTPAMPRSAVADTSIAGQVRL